MTNSADPDQLAFSEANWSGSTLFAKAGYLDRQAWSISVDPDQMPQNAASDQSLHCLSVIQQFLNTRTGQ